ncbi:hydroxyacid dehydrogenase [Streptomyces sp. NPDC059720]|uniref:hydroxyacid dehydrogenase n=1 Tax=Streptomyces sp. NPDC059720 TaxID=3346924 RepID=UPI00367D2589
MTRRLRAALAMRRDMPDKLFSHADRARMERLCNLTSIVLTDFCSAEAIRVLGDIDVLITGWGAPVVDEHVLDRAPSLRVILDVTDCAKSRVDRVCWERGLTVTTAADANARPVAEYTLASILLAGKNVPALRHRYATERRALDPAADHPDIGNAGRSVGIVGASRVGRRVLDLLRWHDLTVFVYDPSLDPAVATALGAHAVTLEDLLVRSSVVSVHAPEVAQTDHLLDRRRLGLLGNGSTLIHTARPALVDFAALTDELVSGRINAFLDVTEPDVPPAGSPLYELPNVVLTPHLSGPLGNELTRLGGSVVDELQRLAQGRPLRCAVSPADLDHIA